MIKQIDIQREIAEGRRKAQLDEQSRRIDAMYAIEHAELVGRVRLLQELLGQTPMASKHLAFTDRDELKRTEEILKRRLVQKWPLRPPASRHEHDNDTQR